MAESSARYSQEETPQFVQRMDSWLASISSLLRSECADNYAATVLMGGFARGWGAFVNEPEGPAPCNDIDIALVTERRLASADLAELRRAATSIVNPCSQHKLAELSPLDLHVDVLNFTTSDIRSLAPSQFHYDLAKASRLIDGQDVLAAAPAMEPSDLDPADALLSICNNSFSVSEALALSEMPEDARRLNVLIFATKASMAAGIAVTIIDGSYSPDPIARIDRLREISQGSVLGRRAPAFVDLVREATLARSLLSDDRQARAAHFVRTASYTMKAAAAYVLHSGFSKPWLDDPAGLAQAIAEVWQAERLRQPNKPVGAKMATAAKRLVKIAVGRGGRSNWPEKARVYSAALPILGALALEDDLTYDADERLTRAAHSILTGSPSELRPGALGWTDTARAMVSALKRQNWIK